MTYVYVCFCWVLFRAQDFHSAMLIMRKMVGIDSVGVQYVYVWLFMIVPFVVLAHLLGSYVNDGVESGGGPAQDVRAAVGRGSLLRNQPIRDSSASAGGNVRAAAHEWFGSGLSAHHWVVVFYLFAAVNSSPFIYFQF